MKTYSICNMKIKTIFFVFCLLPFYFIHNQNKWYYLEFPKEFHKEMDSILYYLGKCEKMKLLGKAVWHYLSKW